MATVPPMNLLTLPFSLALVVTKGRLFVLASTRSRAQNGHQRRIRRPLRAALQKRHR